MSSSTAAQVRVGELVVGIYDLGPEPEWHRKRSLFAPWRRYVAVVPELEALERGASVSEAVVRLVSMHAALLDACWPAKGPLAR